MGPNGPVWLTPSGQSLDVADRIKVGLARPGAMRQSIDQLPTVGSRSLQRLRFVITRLLNRPSWVFAPDGYQAGLLVARAQVGPVRQGPSGGKIWHVRQPQIGGRNSASFEPDEAASSLTAATSR